MVKHRNGRRKDRSRKVPTNLAWACVRLPSPPPDTMLPHAFGVAVLRRRQRLRPADPPDRDLSLCPGIPQQDGRERRGEAILVPLRLKSERADIHAELRQVPSQSDVRDGSGLSVVRRQHGSGQLPELLCVEDARSELSQQLSDPTFGLLSQGSSLLSVRHCSGGGAGGRGGGVC